MGTASDVSVWKLFVYPILAIFIIALAMNLFVQPFIDNGVSIVNQDSTKSALGNTLSVFLTGQSFFQNNTGNEVTLFTIPLLGNVSLNPVGVIVNIVNMVNPFSVIIPTLFPSLTNFINNQITLFMLLPSWFLYPFMFITLFCWLYGLYVLGTMLIP